MLAAVARSPARGEVCVMIPSLELPQLCAPNTVSSWAHERRQIGRSVWLLLLLGTWVTGGDTFVRSGESIQASTIASALGIGERQARRDLQRLRRAGYVDLQNTGRGFRIRLTQSPRL